MTLYFSYKARGTIATDLNGTRDNTEFLNIAQDDALSWPLPTHRTYPSVVNARMQDTVIPFISKSMAVNTTILDIFERLLRLPKGTLANLHATNEVCGSEARIVKTPPNQSTAGIGAHTDFGTLVSTYGVAYLCAGDSPTIRRHFSTIDLGGSRSCLPAHRSGSMSRYEFLASAWRLFD